MNNEVIEASEYGLKKEQVISVEAAFSEKSKERGLISESYAQIIGKDICPEVAKEARTLRLRAVKVKSSISTIHKTQKDFSLQFGKYCDAWKCKETAPIQQIIDSLMEIEKFEERQELEGLAELQKTRVAEISPYIENAEAMDLSGMADEVWDAFLSVKISEYKAKVEAERVAEAERLVKKEAAAKERKRVIDENKKLKAEALERDRLAKIEEDERAKIEADRNEAIRAEEEKKAKRSLELKPYIFFIRDYNSLISLPDGEYEIELGDIKKGAEEQWAFEAKQAEEVRLAHQAAEKKENDDRKARAEAEAKEKKKLADEARTERLERQKVEDELQAKKDQELKAEQDAEAAKQFELNKGDSEKVKDLVSSLEAFKVGYSFKSAKNKKMYKDFGLLVDKVIAHINK